MIDSRPTEVRLTYTRLTVDKQVEVLDYLVRGFDFKPLPDRCYYCGYDSPPPIVLRVV